MPTDDPFEKLAKAIGTLKEIVGNVGTDAASGQRANASLLTARLDAKNLFPKVVTASIDLPSGRSGRLRVLSLRTENYRARGFTPKEVDDVIEAIQVVMEAEMPVILPRWAFDQVMRSWLSEMQLSASMVLSNQRSVVMIDRMLMVRVSKMMSDPRSQMVTLREQTVRDFEGAPDRRRTSNLTLSSSIDS